MDPIAALGLALRRPTLEDAEAAVRLFEIADIAESGESDSDLAETRDFWRLQDLDNDAWLVTDAGDQVIAYAEASLQRQVRIEVWVVVHPDWRRRGIGRHLADLAEARATELLARTPAGARVEILGWIFAASEAGRGFAASRGLAPVRRFWRMRIDMGDEAPAGPVLPDGIVIRAFDPERDARATWQASEEAFSDHWGHIDAPFDEWIRRTQGELFDSSLWFLAVEGEEIAGMALCARFAEMGWVGTLGVRRPWRGRGLGEALLRHAFVEFHRRGRRTVALGVDSESLTGATRLYERAGMHVDRVHELWTRVLRDGRPLGTA